MDEHDGQTNVAYWISLTLVALAIRIIVACVLLGGMGQKSDSLAYAEQARRMVSGGAEAHSYFVPPGRSFAMVPFLWVFGTSDAVVRANAVTIDLACVLMTALLAHQVLYRRSAARLTGWVAACYPSAVMVSGWSYPENFALLCLLSAASLTLTGFRLVVRNGWLALGAWFLSGCLLGSAILTRPSAFSVLFAAIVAWIGLVAVCRVRPAWIAAAARLSWQLALGGGVVFCLGTLCSIAAVLKHHVSLGAGWVVSTNNEMNFFLGNNPSRRTIRPGSWERIPSKISACRDTSDISTLFATGLTAEVP